MGRLERARVRGSLSELRQALALRPLCRSALQPRRDLDQLKAIRRRGQLRQGAGAAAVTWRHQQSRIVLDELGRHDEALANMRSRLRSPITPRRSTAAARHRAILGASRRAGEL